MSNDTIRESLKPCPICKSHPAYEFIAEENFGEFDTHSFVCLKDNDHVVQAIGLSREDAANKWNTRADQAASTRNDAPVSLDDAVRKLSLYDCGAEFDRKQLTEMCEAVMEIIGVKYE